MRNVLLKALILSLCWSLVFAPFPVQAWAPPSPNQKALAHLNTLADLELQAMELTSEVATHYATFDQLFFQAWMTELDPWLQANLPTLLAEQEIGGASGTVPSKASGMLPSAQLPASPAVTPLGKSKGKTGVGTQDDLAMTTAPVDLVASPPATQPKPLSVEEIAALKSAWTALKTTAQQLAAVEELISAYPPLLYPIYAKIKDEQAAIDAGLMRFLQVNVHTITRRIVGDAVRSPFPEVRKLGTCQGGLMGSHAFYQALQAVVDVADTSGQGDVHAMLHQQHACLDPQTSLRHEVAYVAALEFVEAQLQKNNLSTWYPKFAAANVAVILTLWDGKQWWGPTPYYNWLMLNKPALVTALSNAPGLYAFDRLANGMVKLDLCGYAPAAAAVGKGAGQVKKATGPLVPELKLAGATLKTAPYQKNVYTGPTLPPAVDPNQSYTPYGIPWSGNAQDWCKGEQFIPLAPIGDACLQPQVLLDRLTNPTAWGLGNCTIAEFVNAGLICIPPQGQCSAPYGLKDQSMKPVPAIPFQLSHGKSLLQCLVANVQPPQDPILKCAAQTSGGAGGGKGGGGWAAGEMTAGGGRASGGLVDVAFKGTGQGVYTPGSKSCGLNPIGEASEGGDGTTAGSGNDTTETNGDEAGDDDGEEKKKKDDGVKTTVSPDGTTKTYDFSPQYVPADKPAEGATAQGKRGIDPGPSNSTDRTAAPPRSGKDPAWMDTPGGPRGGAGGGASGGGASTSTGSSNGAGGAASGTNGQGNTFGGNSGVEPKTLQILAPSYTPTSEDYLNEDYETILLEHYYQGDRKKLEQAFQAFVLRVQEFIAHSPGIEEVLFTTLNKTLQQGGIPQITSDVFHEYFVAFFDNPRSSSVDVIQWAKELQTIPPFLKQPYKGALFGTELSTSWAAGAEMKWVVADSKWTISYAYPSIYVLSSLIGGEKSQLDLATTIFHERLHGLFRVLLKFQKISMTEKARKFDPKDPGFGFEHEWIYRVSYELLKLLVPEFIDPEYEYRNLWKQSSFNPKNFPNGPGAEQHPGTVVPGDIAFISVGPKVPDKDAPGGWRERYPGAAGMCADDQNCGGSCTIGQAQAEAFNDCILQAAGTSGGGGTVPQTPGGPDPSPMEDGVGALPACADDDMGGAGEDNSGCIAANCPADNPDCCKKKTGSGAPWAIDPSITMQQCYAMYCGEGQTNCPCGGMTSSKSWFMKGQPATQPAFMQKTLPSSRNPQQPGTRKP